MCLLIRTVSHVSDVARGPLLFFFPVSFHFLCMHHLNKPPKNRTILSLLRFRRLNTQEQALRTLARPQS